MSTDLKITSLQPPRPVGFTQASSVMAVVRSRDAESLTETKALLPLKLRAFPHLPVTHVAPFTVPELPLPEMSEIVLPFPSSNPYAATRPSPGRGVVALAILEYPLKLPAASVARTR